MGQTSFPLEEARRLLPKHLALGEVIRAGGQGVVCAGVRTVARSNKKVSQDVAIKFYLDPTQDERVDREIRALQGYSHPNWANLLEHGRISIAERQVRYVAWEFVEGKPLDELLQQGPLPAKKVCLLGRDVSLAIQHIWQKRIVHRDVKPRNIMLRSPSLEAVLIDLGIGRHLSEPTLTTLGFTLGTPGYMSPEQCRAEKQLTCHSDVFSLAVVLQEALLGNHPTHGDQSLLLTSWLPTVHIVPSVPLPLAKVIDAMLHPRAAFRPHPANLSVKFSEMAAST